MAHSHQSQVLSKAAAAQHFCSVVAAFLLTSFGNAVALETVRADEKTLDCKVVAKGTFPKIILAEDDPAIPECIPVVLGGISDLIVEKPLIENQPIVLRLLTDRGPTRKVDTAAGKQRVFLNPSFVPTVLVFSVSGYTLNDQIVEPKKLHAELKRKLSLKTVTGKSITGRTNGLEGDERIASPSGQEMLAPDPNGIDPEGCVLFGDGSFCLAEEYRPSLLFCDSEGIATKRLMPQGVALATDDMKIVKKLPRHYENRKANRGFESLAVSPNESTIWALMQSPFEDEQAQRAGNVRLLGIDSKKGTPVSEFIYCLGNSTTDRLSPKRVVPNDGKLCAMASISDTKLLILEQSDDGDAKLYSCELDGATNVLGDGRPLDGAQNLIDLDVTPVRKTLVADLANLLPSFASDITAGQWQPEPDEKVAGLKLEGLAVLDNKHIIISNDNDFNVDSRFDENEPERQSCVWVISLPQSL